MATARSSRVPEAIGNLYDLFVASPTLQSNGIAVAYGRPSDWRPRHIVVTGNVPDIEQTFQAQGARSRDEAFSIEVIISSLVHGHTMRQSLESAFAMLAVIEVEILRPNFTIAATASEAGPALYSHITPTQVRGFVHDTGNESEITCLVQAVCRI